MCILIRCRADQRLVGGILHDENGHGDYDSEIPMLPDCPGDNMALHRYLPDFDQPGDDKYEVDAQKWRKEDLGGNLDNRQ